jgi:DNA invertase Pin-like site-specific DNA recombinase
MKEKHTAIYVRVSSKRQDQRSQLPDLERWAANRTEPILWYRDKFTGTSMNRPGWAKLQRAMNEGCAATLVCWRLDRLGRTTRGLSALFAELIERNIGFYSLREGIDLSTPAGRLMAHVLASAAQYETELRAERVLAGQAAARAQGKRWGGSKKGRRISVTPEQIEIVRRMTSEGHSVAGMARATGLSRPTIYSIVGKLSART